jgi:uncharacterized protein YndB with AHSA1/START domain
MDRQQYSPGPASGAHIEKSGEKWTLVVVRELRHSPEKVWAALTDPAQLREWAPFDADRRLDDEGATVKLTTVNAPQPTISETVIERSESARVLEYKWGGMDMRWQLEPNGSGTRLTLWHNIARPYITWGAAGWQICFDVLERWLGGAPIGRTVGPAAIQFAEWPRLVKEYAQQFGVEAPQWPPQAGAKKPENA